MDKNTFSKPSDTLSLLFSELKGSSVCPACEFFVILTAGHNRYHKNKTLLKIIAIQNNTAKMPHLLVVAIKNGLIHACHFLLFV